MNIFIADYLPIKNKGEEALLRGIQSLYEEKYKKDINFFVFGQSDVVEHNGNITSFPVKWCYPMFNEPDIFRGRIGLLMRLICSLLYQIGFFPFIREYRKHKEVTDALAKSDAILLAHDGFYNSFCAALGLRLHKDGFNYSVPGTGFKREAKYAFFERKLDRKFYRYSSYNVFREHTCYEYVKQLNLNKPQYLLPDMAFYCKSNTSEIESANAILNKYHICKNPNVVNIGLTICENSISFSGSFLDVQNKNEAHRNFIAEILDGISEIVNCNFFFIPHCIEKGAGNDLVIAEDVVHRMTHPEKIQVISEDLPVNVLRPVIQGLDFMIGERTHSIINSSSMCTPFCMLTCSKDFRSHDIIGRGIGLPNQIIDLDSPNPGDVISKIINSINDRDSIIYILESYKNVIANSRKTLLSII